jgi:hypothetical protein
LAQLLMDLPIGVTVRMVGEIGLGLSALSDCQVTPRATESGGWWDPGGAFLGSNSGLKP